MATTINLDTASRVDITCRKGDTFTLSLTITNAAGDTAGFQENDDFLMQVRDSDTGEVIVNDSSTPFQISVTNATAEQVTAKKIDLTLAASVMENMPSGLYVYDVEQTSGSTVKTLIYGTIKVNEDISES
jgi:hypothetical protein